MSLLLVYVPWAAMQSQVDSDQLRADRARRGSRSADGWEDLSLGTHTRVLQRGVLSKRSVSSRSSARSPSHNKNFHDSWCARGPCHAPGLRAHRERTVQRACPVTLVHSCNASCVLCAPHPNAGLHVCCGLFPATTAVDSHPACARHLPCVTSKVRASCSEGPSASGWLFEGSLSTLVDVHVHTRVWSDAQLHA